MVVKNSVVKLNKNDCKSINNYMLQGWSARESFEKEVIRNGYDPDTIIGYEYRNDKWYWLFKLLEKELNEAVQ